MKRMSLGDATLPVIINVCLLMWFGALTYLWHHNVLVEEKGLYSPFQNGLSLIRYIGLVLFMNIFISLSAIRRDKLWIYIPLVISSLILALGTYYMIRILILD